MSAIAPNRRIRDVLPVLVLGSLPLWYYWPVTFFGKTLVRGDIHAQFLPWKAYWRRSILEEGRLPLWNPYTACGSPFLANFQSSVFQPVDWLLIGLDPSRAFGISLLIHSVLALLMVYALARKVGVSPVGAMLAALAFGFTGFHHIHLFAGNFLTYTAALWFPLLCYTAYGLVESVRREDAFRRQVKWALGLALATVLQVLAGHPQMFFYSIFFTAVWTLALVLPGADGRCRRTSLVVLLGSCAGMVAALVCAVQLLPTLEYIEWSARSGGLDWEEATQFSFSWSRLLTLPFPDYFGSHAEGHFWGYWKNWSSAYVGVLPVFLAIFALCFKGRSVFGRQAAGEDSNGGTEEMSAPGEEPFPWLAVLGVAVLAVLLALGRNNPLYRLVLPIPGFRYFRAPSKYLPYFILMLGLLAGRGWDALWESAVGRERISRWILQCRGWLWGFLGLLLAAGLAFQVGLWMAGEKAPMARAALLQSTGTFLVFGVLGWLLCVGAFWKKNRWSWFAVASVGLLAVDLFVFGSRYFVLENPVVWPKETFDHRMQELFGPGFTRSWRTLLAFHPAIDANHAFVYELTVPGFYDPLSVSHYLQWLQYYELEDPLGIPDGMQPKRMLGPAPWLAALYRFPLPGHWSASRPDLIEQLRPILQVPPEGLSPDDGLVNAPFPPVVFYPKEKARFDPYPWLFDPGRELYLAPGPALPRQAAVWPPPLPERLQEWTETMAVRLPSAVPVQAARLHPEQWVIRYDSDQPGYLFVSEVWYPGWIARLENGEPLAIWRANFAFRAIEAPAGRQEIVLEYRPGSFRWGVRLSVFGGILLLAGYVWTRGDDLRRPGAV